MISVLTGANSYALRQTLRRTVAAFVAEHGEFALEQIEAEHATLNRVAEALTSLPFLAARKLVVLHDPGQNKDYLSAYETALAEVADGTDVLIVESQLDKRTAYAKWLAKKTDYTEHKLLDERGLAEWAVAYVAAQGGSLSSRDAAYLIERTRQNQEGLSRELDKLLLVDKKLQRATMDALTVASPQSSIFALLEAAFAGRAKVALALYAEQRALKVEPPQIIAMIAWQLHLLVLAKTAPTSDAQAIAQQSKQSPYSLKKALSITRNLPLARLQAWTGRLVELDKQSKRSAVDTDAALQAYILSLAM